MVASLMLGPFTPSTLIGGEFNQVLSIGDLAPTWTDLPGVDGEFYSSEVGVDIDVTVIVFTCTSCPYAEDVESRLVELDTWLASRRGRLVAINVNKVKEDLPPQMKARAEERGFQFPYLFDETQKIAKDFGATRTPEFFVLDKSRKITYMGSLDDSPDGKAVTVNYLRDAVEATLHGKPVVKAETVPIGCLIRFVRDRKK